MRQIGLYPDAVSPPEVDEAPRREETPVALVRRLAVAKAEAVAARPEAAGAFVAGADTVVACGRRMLPKARDEATARHCLHLLSGRRHRVYGGICVLAPDGRRAVRAVQTAVAFKRLAAAEIDAYIESGEWRDKAGGYAVQGRAAIFVRALNGSYSNVVGLSLFDLHQMLVGLGYHRHLATAKETA